MNRHIDAIEKNRAELMAIIVQGYEPQAETLINAIIANAKQIQIEQGVGIGHRSKR